MLICKPVYASINNELILALRPPARPLIVDGKGFFLCIPDSVTYFEEKNESSYLFQ